MKRLIALTLLILLVVGSFPAGRTNANSAPHKVRRAISGRITDPNGALVVGATITIVGRDCG